MYTRASTNDMTVKASRANQKTIFIFIFAFIYIISTESREQYSKGARGTCGVEADCALESSALLSSALQSDGHCFAPRCAIPLNCLYSYSCVLFSAHYCIVFICGARVTWKSTVLSCFWWDGRHEMTRQCACGQRDTRLERRRRPHSQESSGERQQSLIPLECAASCLHSATRDADARPDRAFALSEERVVLSELANRIVEPLRIVDCAFAFALDSFSQRQLNNRIPAMFL